MSHPSVFALKIDSIVTATINIVKSVIGYNYKLARFG